MDMLEWLKDFLSISDEISFNTILILGGISIFGTLKFWHTGQVPRRKTCPTKGKLYYHSCFRSNRCIWLLRELNAAEDFELVDVDVWDKTSTKCKVFTENIHPHATVPALQIGDEIILESGAICMYLAESYQKCLPRDIRDFYNIMFYICATLDEVMERLFIQFFFKEPKGEEDILEIQHAQQKFNVCAKYLESRLKGKEYICGNQFSVADCVVGYNMWWASEMKNGILLESYPDLLLYLKRLRNRPAFKQTWSIS